MELMLSYALAVIALLIELLPYMLVGFVIAGVVEEFVSKERLLRYFGSNDLRSLVRAAAAGFVVSTCSCGAIPLAASLRNRGASTAAILTFLFASPWLGVPMLMVYVRFLGLWQTAALVVLALSIALVAGTILAVLERSGQVAQGVRYAVVSDAEVLEAAPAADRCNEVCATGAHSDYGTGPERTLSHRVFVVVPRRIWILARDIGFYLLLGVFLAAIPRALVGAEMVSAYLGTSAGPWAILIVIPVSAVIEACSEGFAIVAGQLYQQGASLAVVFVMTMVGVATDVTELTVLWKKFGRRTTLVYLGLGTSLTVMTGLAMQWVLGFSQDTSQ